MLTRLWLDANLSPDLTHESDGNNWTVDVQTKSIGGAELVDCFGTGKKWERCQHTFGPEFSCSYRN